MDWKEKLASLAGSVPQDTSENKEDLKNETAKGPAQRQKDPLHVVIDKKGRKGKVATIIEGFELSDREVADIASELKQRIGTGGSSRGGEILLQGEWKEKVIQLLRDKGYVAR